MVIQKLSKSSVKALEPKEKEYFVWDTELKGFGVRVSPKGTKTFVLRIWVPESKQPQVLQSIGGAHLLELEEAKKEAKLRIKATQFPEPKAPESITFEQLNESYLLEQAKAYPRSVKECRRRAINYLLPAFGKQQIKYITRADVAAFHVKLGTMYPYQANRCKEQLGRMFQLAKLWYLLPEDHPNPAKGVTDFPEEKRNRWLRPEELRRLAIALKPEPIMLQCFFKLKLAMCCRKGELLNLMWRHVSETGIEIGKTKNGSPHFIHMTDFIRKTLDELPRVEGNPFLFPGDVKGRPRNTVDKAWQRIRKRAELNDVRIHDLRRTGASLRIQDGESLEVVGKMLNHKCRDTTEGYAYLADENVKHAFKRHGDMIAQYFTADP